METGIPGLKEIEPLRVVDGVKEWSIPGWTDYTIREDLSVWSHKKKNKAPQRIKLSKEGGADYVRMYTDTKQTKRSAQRLLLYSRYGIPEERWEAILKAGVLRNGKLIPYKEIYADGFSFERGRRSRSVCPLEYTVKNLEVIQESAELQLKALETRDGTELLKWLVSKEETAINLYINHHKTWGEKRRTMFHELWLLYAADAVDALIQNNRFRMCMPSFVKNEVQRKVKEILGQKKLVNTNQGLAVEYSADTHRIIENGGQLT